MKALLKPVLAAGLVLSAAAPFAATPAAAQVVKGIGVMDPGVVMANSAAFKTAESQREVTYKQYYDAAEARNAQIEAQLKPLRDKYNADAQAPNPNTADLQKQRAAMQQIDQLGERELQQILAPVAMSQAYVKEQIEDAMPKAIEAAATKKNITLILNSDSGTVFIRDQSYNMNPDVVAELDAALPMAQLSPPPDWLPRELRERLARQAAIQAAINGQSPAQAATGGATPAPATNTVPAGPPVESR